MTIRLSRKIPHDVEATQAYAPSPSSEASNSPDLLSIIEAAAFVGVAPVTMRRWIRERRIPAWRIGAQIRIDKADLIKFMRVY